MRPVAFLALAFGLCLAACAPGGAHGQISRAAATSSALAAVEELARSDAAQTSTAMVTGIMLVDARLSTRTTSVSDSRGNVLRVDPAPGQAWVVEFTAPPQGIWGSISGIAEVDSSSGVVAGAGYWAIPANAPVKGG